MIEVIRHSNRTTGKNGLIPHVAYCFPKHLPGKKFMVAMADFGLIHIRKHHIEELMCDIRMGKIFLEFYSFNPLAPEPDKCCGVFSEPYYDKENKILYATLTPEGPFRRALLGRMLEKFEFGISMKHQFDYRGEMDIETKAINGFRVVTAPSYR